MSEEELATVERRRVMFMKQSAEELEELRCVLGAHHAEGDENEEREVSNLQQHGHHPRVRAP